MRHRPPSRRRSRRRARVGLGGTLSFLFLAVAATVAVFLLVRHLLPETGAGGRIEAAPPAGLAAVPPQALGGHPPPAAEDPVPQRGAEPRAGSALELPPGHGARVALVIDDLGRSLTEVEVLGDLGVPLTYAVLPFESRTAEVVAALAARGEEILLHLPMEPENGANPGPGALSAAMSEAEIVRSTRAALERVPGAVGVNNHMGSSVSADPRAMRAVLSVLRGRDLYFLDSRTSPDSVAYRLAADLGVAAAERQVFLDRDPSPEAVAGELARLFALARQRGAAIAIGHPYPVTLEALAREVPRAVAAGYEIVPVSYLLERRAAPPG